MRRRKARCAERREGRPEADRRRGGVERWKGKQEGRFWLLGLSIGEWPCSVYSWLLSSGSRRNAEANLLLPESIFLFVPRHCWKLSWKMPPPLKRDINISCFHHFHFPPYSRRSIFFRTCAGSFSLISFFQFFIVFLYFFRCTSFSLAAFLPPYCAPA